jgi:hypothetical protein
MKSNLMPVVLASFLAGCASVSVERDYDTAFEFSGLKTFAWQHAEQPVTGNPRMDNDLRDERVREAISQTLALKGYRQADRADADFLVAYFMEFQRQLNADAVSFGIGRGGYGRYGGVGYNTGISVYDQAHLTIDIIDPVQEKMIWRGVGTRSAYNGSSPKKTIRIIHASVAEILKKFPPK